MVGKLLRPEKEQGPSGTVWLWESQADSLEDFEQNKQENVATHVSGDPCTESALWEDREPRRASEETTAIISE